MDKRLEVGPATLDFLAKPSVTIGAVGRDVASGPQPKDIAPGARISGR